MLDLSRARLHDASRLVCRASAPPPARKGVRQRDIFPLPLVSRGVVKTLLCSYDSASFQSIVRFGNSTVWALNLLYGSPTHVSDHFTGLQKDTLTRIYSKTARMLHRLLDVGPPASACYALLLLLGDLPVGCGPL